MAIFIKKGNAEDGGFVLEGNIHVTKREIKALAAIGEGNDNENAAKKLGISYTTFRNHTYNVMKKLGAKNRTEALVKAIENGIVVVTRKSKIQNIDQGYYICIFCGKTFNSSDLVWTKEEPFIVNHVLIEPPEEARCPYCNGLASSEYDWARVRYYHPEYPKIPEKGVEYSTSELEDEEIEAQKERMKEKREGN